MRSRGWSWIKTGMHGLAKSFTFQRKNKTVYYKRDLNGISFAEPQLVVSRGMLLCIVI